MKSKIILKVKSMFRNKSKLFIIVISMICIGILIIFSKELFFKSKLDTKICTVTYDTNGGNYIEVTKLNCGETMKDIPIPNKTGFIFKGWYLDNFLFKDNINILKDITLKAKWEQNQNTEVVIVSFDSNGGTTIEPIELQKGQKIFPPPNPKKENYSFKGWIYNNELFDFKYSINENITLVAEWGPNTEKEIDYYDQINKNMEKTTNVDIGSNLSNENMEILINNLLGDWYYVEDPSVYIKVSYTYFRGQKVLEFKWNNIDLYGSTIYPNNSYGSSMYFTLPIDNENLNSWLNSVSIKSTNGEVLNIDFSKIYKFTHQEKELNLDKYDKYLGKWYLIGGSEYSYINITKEISNGMNYYAIDMAIHDGNSVRYESLPKESISHMEINFNNTIFDKNNIRIINGNLIYNNMTYSLKKNAAIISAKKIRVDYSGDSNAINIGTTNKYKIISDPVNATDILGQWKSKDIKIATVSNDGLVTGVGIGTTEICYTTTNGLNDCEYINVLPVKVQNIKLNKSNLILYPGNQEQLTINVTPKNATNQKVSWNTSDSSVAIVDSNGKITAKGKGITIITVKTDDGNHIATCTVEVKTISVTSITLKTNALSMKRTEETILSFNITPTNATNQKASWSTSNSNVAIVDSDGKITAKGKGTAIITVKTDDGNHIATCTVEVTNPKLLATASITHSSITIGNQTLISSVGTEIKATGGSGKYLYNIKLYRNGVLINQTLNSTQNSISSNYSDGDFSVEYSVTDSDGETYSGTLGPISVPFTKN